MRDVFYIKLLFGYKISIPEKYRKIRIGINQSDTSLTVEENLRLGLESYQGVKNVDFDNVWGQSHTMAERT